MILVFCGTPRFAVPTLEKLVHGWPFRRAGRHAARPASRTRDGIRRISGKGSRNATWNSRRATATIKNNQEFRAQLKAIGPDAIIVVGYGRIIPQWMIDLPRFGNLNLHASLLPKYRGAAPIQWAVASGETVTGITTMRIDAGLDTGDILMQRELPILPDDTAETLAPKLASMGAELMVETLRGLERGTVTPVSQDHSLASLAPILKKEDGRMDFARPAVELFDRMRGFRPWPGAFTIFRAKTLQVHRAQPAQDEIVLPPGTIVVDGTRLLATCGEHTALELLEVQMEGKRRMTAQEFLNGYQPKTGERLGE